MQVRLALVGVLLFAFGAMFSLPVEAQSTVAGRVVRPGGDSVVGVSSAMVTLHRVGSDHAGPLDSVRTSRNGAFSFSYQRTGVDDAIYFVSSMYAGVAYFTPPLKAGDVAGDDGIITVFDTTSRDVPFTLRGEHVIVAAPDSSGRRYVTQVFDISNDTSVTRIARGESVAAWSTVVPAAARSPAVVDGDIPAVAVKFAHSRASIYAPFAPGLKQLAIRYELGDDGLPLHVTLERPVGVLEVLVEDRGGRANGGALRSVGPVGVGGREFQRFLASNVVSGTDVSIEVPSVTPAVKPWFAAMLTLVIGGAMTLALAYALRRR